MKVYVHGIPAHAAFPEGSESAEVKMAGLLKKSGVLDEDAANLMDAICEMFGDYYGASRRYVQAGKWCFLAGCKYPL